MMRIRNTGDRSQKLEARGRKCGERGFTLVEMLVVITIFSVLAVLATESIFLTLRSAAKSESVRRARENLNFATSVMERQLISARGLTVSECTATKVEYTDIWGNSGNYFECDGNRIASHSGKTSETVYLTDDNDLVIDVCDITCNDAAGDSSNPSVDIDITARVGGTGVEGASVNITDKFFLRTY